MRISMPKCTPWGGVLVLLFLFQYVIYPGPPDALALQSGALRVNTASGKSMQVSRGSYALLIGAGEYSGDWPRIGGQDSLLAELGQVLHDQGFTVQSVLNPDSDALEKAFEEFIERYGYEPGNRLLFFFSGHGATRKDGRMSYLVPVDAPSFHQKPQMVKRKALSMSRVLAWCREMEARQAMFIFDCRLAPMGLIQQPAESPFAITEQSAEPVRYFIFAGENGETPPVARTFSPALLSGLAGKADLNQDGYITGAELGHFTEVAMQAQNTVGRPFYGKTSDMTQQGDFVFALAGSGSQAEKDPERVERLLKEAEALFEARKFTTPKNASALDRYNQVLRLEPTNSQAQKGLGLIIGQYALWARKLIKTGELQKAEAVIQRAESVREADRVVMELWEELKLAKAGPGINPQQPAANQAQADGGGQKGTRLFRAAFRLVFGQARTGPARRRAENSQKPFCPAARRLCPHAGRPESLVGQ